MMQRKAVGCRTPGPRFSWNQRPRGTVHVVVSRQLVGRKVIRPHLGSVEHTQDANAIWGQGISRNIGRSGNDQFARARHPPGSAAFGKLDQAKHRLAICSSTAIAARGLSASMCMKTASRSASANADHVSLMILLRRPCAARPHVVMRNAPRHPRRWSPVLYLRAPASPWRETRHREPRCC